MDTLPVRENTLFVLDGVVLMMRVRRNDIDVLQKLFSAYAEGTWQRDVFLRAVERVDATLISGLTTFLSVNVLEVCPRCGAKNIDAKAKCYRCSEPMVLYRKGVQDV